MNWESIRDLDFNGRHCDNPLDCKCFMHPASVIIRNLPDGRTYNRTYCNCCGYIYGAKVF